MATDAPRAAGVSLVAIAKAWPGRQILVYPVTILIRMTCEAFGWHLLRYLSHPRNIMAAMAIGTHRQRFFQFIIVAIFRRVKRLVRIVTILTVTGYFCNKCLPRLVRIYLVRIPEPFLTGVAVVAAGRYRSRRRVRGFIQRIDVDFYGDSFTGWESVCHIGITVTFAAHQIIGQRRRLSAYAAWVQDDQPYIKQAANYQFTYITGHVYLSTDHVLHNG
ncbi:MAG: hypothetical protein ACK2UO_08160 [Caldilineaceae bacterium]